MSMGLSNKLLPDITDTITEGNWSTSRQKGNGPKIQWSAISQLPSGQNNPYTKCRVCLPIHTLTDSVSFVPHLPINLFLHNLIPSGTGMYWSVCLACYLPNRAEALSDQAFSFSSPFSFFIGWIWVLSVELGFNKRLRIFTLQYS